MGGRPYAPRIELIIVLPSAVLIESAVWPRVAMRAIEWRAMDRRVVVGLSSLDRVALVVVSVRNCLITREFRVVATKFGIMLLFSGLKFMVDIVASIQLL